MPFSDLQSLNDVTLVAYIRDRKAGWSRAFAELIDRHHDDLLRRCRIRLGNLHDAEDAAQDTVLRAYRGLSGFKGESSFRTWLYAIADNQCHTVAQRRMRHVLGEHLRELIALHQQTRGWTDRASHEAVARVHRTLAQLPEPARDVLVLRYFGEMSLEEIAGTLGIGLSAAKMRLYRALDQFAARYGGQQDVTAM